MLDASGNEVFVVRIDGVNVGFGYPVGQEPTNGATFTGTTGRDGDPSDSGDGVSSSSEPYTNIVCFAEGTLITTPDGERLVENLKPGDQVMTLDRGTQPIRWTRRDTHALETASTEDKPVLIKAGSLGTNLPEQDLIVSPQHRILVGSHRQLQGWFETEAFAPAKSLTKLQGIRHMKGKSKITWIHFACDQHEIVTANGCLSESLLLGPMVINGMTSTERQAVIDIFGPAPTLDAALNGPPAREYLKVGAVRRQLSNSSKVKRQLVTKETRKWEVDAAMEQYESERLREANPKSQVDMKRVA